MAGLGLLILLTAFVWLSGKLVHYIWENLNKSTAIIVTIAILASPFLDAIIGRAVLKKTCEAEARIVVKRSIPNIEAIFLSNGVTGDSANYYGYLIVEGKGFYGRKRVEEDSLSVRYVTSYDDPSVAVVAKSSPVAKYGLWIEAGPKYFWLNAERYSVNNRSKNDELGSVIWYSFRGGWAERVLMAFSSAGPSSKVASCGTTRQMLQKRIELLHATLNPAPPDTKSHTSN